ncbi:MAG TPA: flagellar hook-basal body protein, partial [Pirellulales bacterium]|nr:flagellar hook-basal body protein [Pirellulales bacterium]
ADAGTMPYGLYISAEGAQAQSTRMEVIANNLANAATPGFKRELALFQARFAEEIQRGEAPPGAGTLNDIGGGVETLATVTDFSTGPLKQTGVPTDLAIDGEGFFMVRRNGQDFLTRSGNFVFNSTGGLVTPDGDPVLSVTGAPIIVNPELGPWHMTPDGGIAQGGDLVYLAIARPNSLGDLVKTGDNLFASLAPVKPLDVTQRKVATGVLEQSGVQPVLEMTEMIETSRAFEANVNMIRNQDQILGELVSRVLKT